MDHRAHHISAIDVHTHTFNASDLSVEGFLRSRWPDLAGSDIPGRLFQPLTELVAIAVEGLAPNADMEHALLDRLEARPSSTTTAAPMRHAYHERLVDQIRHHERASGSKRQLAEYLGDELVAGVDDGLNSSQPRERALAAEVIEEFASAVEVAEQARLHGRGLTAQVAADHWLNDLELAVQEEFQRLEQSGATEEWDIAKLALQSSVPDPKVGALLPTLKPSPFAWLGKFFRAIGHSMKRLFRFLGRQLSRFLGFLSEHVLDRAFGYMRRAGQFFTWAGMLLQYRLHIGRTLIRNYSENRGNVSLYISALVDFQRWYEPNAVKPATSLEQQVVLMRRTTLAHGGRIHGYVSYCPWRDIETHGAVLDLVACAVERSGCLGVKLYPPMGFRAWGNGDRDIDFSMFYRTPEELGPRIDEHLLSLYSYCAENGVPIIAHCNNSNHSRDEVGERAHPIYWKRLMDEHESLRNHLRVNLAHAGGIDDLNESKGWGRDVVDLMEVIEGGKQRYPGIYADTGFLSDALNKEALAEHVDHLAGLIRAGQYLGNRLMYGSDWIMLAMKPGHKGYYEAYRTALDAALGEDRSWRIFAGNALEFLGLSPESNNYDRLGHFYRSNGIEEPAWYRAIATQP